MNKNSIIAILGTLVGLMAITLMVVSSRNGGGGAGAAMVLKGGSLTRKYLTNGVSSESQSQALAEFKETAKDDMIEVLSVLRDSKRKTGYDD